jgi:hypothetical protein
MIASCYKYCTPLFGKITKRDNRKKAGSVTKRRTNEIIHLYVGFVKCENQKLRGTNTCTNRIRQ